MRVKEAMIKEVVSLRPDENAREALALLFKMRISGLPVIGEDGRLAGMFTEKEVLSYALPSYIKNVGKFVYGQNPKSTKNRFQALCGVKVAQIMRKDVVTIREDAALCEAAKIMLIQKARRLPVLDAAGKVTGIIARNDILRALDKEAGC